MHARLLVLVLSSVFLVIAYCFSEATVSTGAFRLRKILPEKTLNKGLHSSFTINNEMQQALSQNYYYLEKGRQLFAFVSEDQRYVIKFFRIDKLSPKFWHQFTFLDFFLPKWRRKIVHQRERKLQKWKKSFSLAYEKMKDMTAMLAIHLDLTENLNQKISLYDPSGRESVVDLDKTYFILQKKCDLLIPTLIAETKPKQMKQIISSFLKNTLNRYQLGICNKTRRCLDNIGVIDTEVIEFDIGEFIPIEKNSPYELHYMQFTDVLSDWLKENKPDYVTYFEEERKVLLQSQL